MKPCSSEIAELARMDNGIARRGTGKKEGCLHRKGKERLNDWLSHAGGFNSIIRESVRLASSTARKAKTSESLPDVDPNLLHCKWEGIRLKQAADRLSLPSPSINHRQKKTAAITSRFRFRP